MQSLHYSPRIWGPSSPRSPARLNLTPDSDSAKNITLRTWVARKNRKNVSGARRAHVREVDTDAGIVISTIENRRVQKISIRNAHFV
ncbi:hypothetical protein Ddc_14573 [Ditylenchus destructor]|nr:hypothetical protein Ddc_14573 [Ditylenchus destructor]